MDALGVAAMGAGAFLLYAAIRGEHPWTLFTQVLGANPHDLNTAGKIAAANPSTAASGQVIQQADGTVVANGYAY